jgi:hypothetical protein
MQRAEQFFRDAGIAMDALADVGEREWPTPRQDAPRVRFGSGVRCPGEERGAESSPVAVLSQFLLRESGGDGVLVSRALAP